MKIRPPVALFLAYMPVVAGGMNTTARDAARSKGFHSKPGTLAPHFKR